jgi:hypothetical protein
MGIGPLPRRSCLERRCRRALAVPRRVVASVSGGAAPTWPIALCFALARRGYLEHFLRSWGVLGANLAVDNLPGPRPVTPGQNVGRLTAIVTATPPHAAHVDIRARGAPGHRAVVWAELIRRAHPVTVLSQTERAASDPRRRPGHLADADLRLRIRMDCPDVPHWSTDQKAGVGVRPSAPEAACDHD